MRKSTLKAIVAGFLCLLAAAVPGTLFYLLWSWCIGLVPATSEWAGLIKIGVTLIMVFCGGGATIGLTILCVGVAASIAAVILD